jgi:hypothetical protein
MIDATVKGKLGIDSSRAHERAEDLLTSTVFGLLRYLPHDTGLIAVIQRARRAYLQNETLEVWSADVRNARWLLLEHARSFTIEFWPSLACYGQPDLLIQLLDEKGKCVHLVLIEVKLYSAKSGEAGAEEDSLQRDAPDPDQLVRYWQGLDTDKYQVMDIPKTVIYLTSHPAPPSDDLEVTLRRILSRNLPTMRLAWLSWRDIWQVMTEMARKPNPPLPSLDLKRLLAYMGFQYFDGFHNTPYSFPVLGRFYVASGWFEQKSPLKQYPVTTTFWRNK